MIRACFVIALAGASFFAQSASAQSLGDSVSQLFQTGEGTGCDAGVANALTNAIRSGIETEVKRAEEALQMPAPLADMGCLDNLLNINLDTLISVPSVQGMIQQAMAQGEEAICGYAQQMVSKATQPLQTALSSVPSFENLGIPGFESQSMSIDFEAPQSGFGGEGQINIEAPVDLNEGTALREIYKDLGRNQ